MYPVKWRESPKVRAPRGFLICRAQSHYESMKDDVLTLREIPEKEVLAVQPEAVSYAEKNGVALEANEPYSDSFAQRKKLR